LIKIIREVQMDFVVDKLIDFSASKDDELRDISGLGKSFIFLTDLDYLTSRYCLALKTITSELPPDGKIAEKACAKLAPKLLAQISNVGCHCYCQPLVIHYVDFSLILHLRPSSRPSPSFQS
jgi:cullin-associated NEDD8-dissociated protein 1